MEKEISSGTMLGIVLIALAAVIGLGFGVFSIAKGVANEGTVGVQDNLGTVSESAFDDYNDKIVTGTMVKSAIQNFKGKSCAILVNTTAMDKEVVTYREHKTPTVFTFDGAGAGVGVPSLVVVDEDAGTTSGGVKGGEAIDAPSANHHHYINYNTILDVSAFATAPDSPSITLKDGIYNAIGIPYLINPSNGKVVFDYSVGGQTRTGNCEYLAPTAKFDANLIKDETGTTIGIVFTQRAS